jgi:hypothetical protein
MDGACGRPLGAEPEEGLPRRAVADADRRTLLGVCIARDTKRRQRRRRGRGRGRRRTARCGRSQALAYRRAVAWRRGNSRPQDGGNATYLSNFRPRQEGILKPFQRESIGILIAGRSARTGRTGAVRSSGRKTRNPRLHASRRRSRRRPRPTDGSSATGLRSESFGVSVARLAPTPDGPGVRARSRSIPSAAPVLVRAGLSSTSAAAHLDFT